MITEGPHYVKMVSQMLLMIMKMGEKVDLKALFENKKPEIIEYVKSGTKIESLNDSIHSIFDAFKNDITEEKYSSIQAGFFAHEEWMKLALKEYCKISTRPLKSCHPDSLPYFAKKLQSQFDNEALS
jgi:hypothetical protein